MTRRRRAAALAAAALMAAGAATAPAAQARWGEPFELAPPGTLDVQAPQLAFSDSGVAAAAFGVADVDAPGSAAAYLTLAAGTARPPQAVAGAAQILSLAYDGRSLELLTGASSANRVCCSSAQAIEISAQGHQGPARTLVGGLAGETLGQLLTLPGGRMLAAIATERGVWVVQSSGGNRFGAPHLLTGRGQMPQALATAPLADGRSLVIWTTATGPAGAADPRTVWAGEGSRAGAPRRGRSLLTVPAGHRIDEIGVAPRAGHATIAWTESWYDRAGAYHSQVMAIDDAPGATVRALSGPGRQASGLQFTGDAAGDQAAAWESCTAATACAAQVATRRAGGSFGPARTLGASDPAQTPAVAMGAHGQIVAAWISGGDPFGSVQASPRRGSGAAAMLSGAGYAHDITVAAGPGGRALAAWSQGTLNPSVVGAAFGG